MPCSARASCCWWSRVVRSRSACAPRAAPPRDGRATPSKDVLAGDAARRARIRRARIRRARRRRAPPRAAADDGVVRLRVPREFLAQLPASALAELARADAGAAAAGGADERDELAAGGAAERHLLDALALGLDVYEKAGARAETAHVRREFERLAARMDAWDARLRERVEGQLRSGEAQTRLALDQYLGERGVLASSVERLRAELGDPARAGSIPAATARLLDAQLDGAQRRVASAVDLSAPDSELGRFLGALRAEHAQWREASAAQSARLSDDIAARHAEVREALHAQGLLADAAAAAPEANVKGRAFEEDVADALRALAGRARRRRRRHVDDARARLARQGGRPARADRRCARAAAAARRGRAAGGGAAGGDAAASIAVEVKSGAFTMAGAKSLERQVRDAMATRGARARASASCARATSASGRAGTRRCRAA